MKAMLIGITILIFGTILQASDLHTVNKVILERYLGTWYQYAYFPNSFQPKDCGMTTAEYSLDAKGNIVVHNVCWEDAAMTKIKRQAKGKAFVQNKANTKLKVQFFWPFRGDYWIIGLDEKDYSYAVVSEPKKRYLWILTRNPSLPADTYQSILADLRTKGFDLQKLVITGIPPRNP